MCLAIWHPMALVFFGEWLKDRDDCVKIGNGSVAEWLKAHDSKSCGRVTVSEVRILSLPPTMNSRKGYFCLCLLGVGSDGIIKLLVAYLKF